MPCSMHQILRWAFNSIPLGGGAATGKVVPTRFCRPYLLHTNTLHNQNANSSDDADTNKGGTVRRELVANGIVRLVLDAPRKRNALSLGMMALLLDELQKVDSDTSIRAVILAAEGPAFSAGHDLRELTADQGIVYHRKVFAKCIEMMECVQQMQLPVIAEVDGIAAAAGCQLVASCDIVVASDKSTFMVPGIKAGLFCSTPSIPLSRNVPRKIAMDMLLTARALTAQEALNAGLVSRVVPSAETKAEALRVAEEITKMSRSVLALGKAFFYAQLEQNSYNANRHGAAMMCENLKLSDAQEGISAFIEKRTPKWTHSEQKAIKD